MSLIEHTIEFKMDRLRDELESLRADRDRLDWLEANPRPLPGLTIGVSPVYVTLSRARIDELRKESTEFSGQGERKEP